MENGYRYMNMGMNVMMVDKVNRALKLYYAVKYQDKVKWAEYMLDDVIDFVNNTDDILYINKYIYTSKHKYERIKKLSKNMNLTHMAYLFYIHIFYKKREEFTFLK